MLARAALDATASEFACAALDESPFLSRAALLDRKLHGSAQPGRHAGDALRPGLGAARRAGVPRQDRV